MGGTNESVLDKKETETVLQGESLLEAQPVETMQKAFTSPTHIQTQTIRQHVSGGEVHFHLDDQKLKAAIPVADFFNVKRQIAMLRESFHVDLKNNTLIEFRPWFANGTLDLSVHITKVTVSDRFNKVTKLA